MTEEFSGPNGPHPKLVEREEELPVEPENLRVVVEDDSD